jgi:predicted transposase/invertase (TIGR01784 family)
MPFKAYLAILHKFEEIAKVRALTKEEKFQYDCALNTYRTNRSAWDYAMETSREEGMKEGMREGIEKGMKKGVKEGVKEGMKKTASNLKKLGIPTDVIIKATKLSAEEIEKL